jgi:hypothetical protein
MRAALFTPSRILIFVFICFLLPLRAQAAAFGPDAAPEHPNTS